MEQATKIFEKHWLKRTGKPLDELTKEHMKYCIEAIDEALKSDGKIIKSTSQIFLKESIRELFNLEKSIIKSFVRIELDEDYKCSNDDLGRYTITYQYALHLIHLGQDIHRAELKLCDELKRRWYI